MINGPPLEDSALVLARLTPDTVDMALHRLNEAIGGGNQNRMSAVTLVRRLRTLVDACIPVLADEAARSGELPAILGTAITLRYPLMELERYLGGLECDIGDAAEAAHYLSFVRHHLWRLERLIRHSADRRA